MLETAFHHLDVDGSGELEAHEILNFCRGINPTKAEDELKEMMSWMDKDGDVKISKSEYMEAMDFLTTILADEEFEMGVLETLAMKHSVRDMPNRTTKLMALFRHLDVDGGGVLELDELLAVANDANPAADFAAAKAQLAWLDGDRDDRVSAAEFVEAMEFLTAYLSDEDLDTSLEELMAYDAFTYRFNASAYLGHKGVLALFRVLRADQTFTGLDLRGCGLRNDGAAALCEALSGHQSIAYLDVGNNPVSEGGVEAIVRLCDNTPNLKTVRYDGCYFVRGWSNVSAELEPNPNTGGGPIDDAVHRNKNPPPPAPTGDAAVAALDIAELLRFRKSEVKTLFYTLAGPDGRLSFQELRDGLADQSEEWGALSEHLARFISPEHIFSTRGGTDSADVDQDGTLSYTEFARALKSEGTRAKVLEACRQKRVELKVLFYTLAGPDGELTIEELSAGLKEALEDQAEEWGFTAAEMKTVFNPESFGAGGVVDEEVLEGEGVVDEDAEATAGDGDLDANGKLSWVEFYAKLVGLQ